MVTSKDRAKPQQAYSQGNVQQIWLRARTGRSPNGRIVRTTCSEHGMSKDGTKPQKEYSQGNVQRTWLRARTGQSPNGNIAQGNVQQIWLRARTGRSPRRNTAQGNALGVCSLTNWRAVSAKGKRKTLHWLLLRLQRANYFVHCYPGCYPGLYTYWAFSPSLQLFMFAATILLVCCDVPFARTYIYVRCVCEQGLCDK
ncbi:hypothetical protein [Prevotella sp. TCVGH]|uniref:hypothetical protein n=1 Tax=Prevotella sp. TCVGH TaxID=2182433 RepID=UPI00201DF660|nr:hypothetical protein [Prevotella sp. TCVGH]